jgi:hypothetical protein
MNAQIRVLEKDEDIDGWRILTLTVLVRGWGVDGGLVCDDTPGIGVGVAVERP